jgi:hypothetical protein
MFSKSDSGSTGQPIVIVAVVIAIALIFGVLAGRCF